MLLGIKAKRPSTCDCDSPHPLTPGMARSHMAVFVAGAADPFNPRCCAECLSQIANTLAACEVTLDDAKQHRDGKAFFAACLSLLHAFTRAPPSVIRNRLYVAGVNCREARMRHAPGAIEQDSVYERFVTALLLSFVSGLVFGSRPLDDFPLTSSKAHWPSDLSHIIPNDVESTADMLIFWCCVAWNDLPFVLLGKSIKAARMALLPALLQSPRRECLVWSIATALSPQPITWPSRIPFRAPEGINIDTSHRGLGKTARTVMTLISSLTRSSNSRTEDIRRLVSGFEQQLLGPASSLGKIFPAMGPDAAETARAFTEFLRRELHHASAAPVPVIPVSHLFHEYFHSTYSRYTFCSNRECAAAGVTTTHMRAFQQCKACSMARYCNRDCQVRDWKYGAVPHKEVCAILAKITGAIPVAQCNVALFSQQWDELNLAPEDVRLVHEWLLSTGALPAFPVGS